MTDDNDDGLNGQPRRRALNQQPTPPSPSVSTNNESTPTGTHLNSPAPQPPPAASSVKAIPHLDSQPMTKESSLSSLPSLHGASAADTNGPSPYGTRSRNRTGHARPNYAEDKELDMEFEWASTKKSQAHGASTVAAIAQVGESEKSIGVSTRRSSNTTAALTASKAAAAAAAANAPKDIPGTSSFALVGDGNAAVPPPASKKRKAPGGNHNPANASSGLGHSTSNGHSRRAAAATSSQTYRETNMLSFEKSQGYLINGQLVADDETTLGINGRLIQGPFFFFSG